MLLKRLPTLAEVLSTEWCKSAEMMSILCTFSRYKNTESVHNILHEYLSVENGVDKAENEPYKICCKGLALNN